MKTLRDDKEAASKFCEKEERAIQQIYAHIDFQDEHFPEWLNEENEQLFVFAEGQTRVLQSLKKKVAPDVFEDILEEISEKPIGTKHLRRIIKANTPYKPIRYEDRTVNDYLEMWKHPEGRAPSKPPTHKEYQEQLLRQSTKTKREWKESLDAYAREVMKGGTQIDTMIWYYADMIQAYLRLYEDYSKLLEVE